MWVKICANTNLEDALLAAEFGADAVGFVFAPSTRRVTPQQVGAITRALPAGVETVGVFAEVPPAEVVAAAAIAGLSTVQLHFNPTRQYANELRELLPEAVAVIQVLSWDVADADAAASAARIADELEAGTRLLIDAKVGAHSGGTGVTFDWHAARPLFAARRARHSMILAGGLRPGNVIQAIETLRPWGVDVASGVEREVGRKDPEKMKAFIENARSA